MKIIEGVLCYNFDGDKELSSQVEELTKSIFLDFDLTQNLSNGDLTKILTRLNDLTICKQLYIMNYMMDNMYVLSNSTIETRNVEKILATANACKISLNINFAYNNSDKKDIIKLNEIEEKIKIKIFDSPEDVDKKYIIEVMRKLKLKQLDNI